MEIGSAIEWVTSMPLVVLILAVFLWWILGCRDKGLCPQCSAPKIFGDKCISCGNISAGST